MVIDTHCHLSKDDYDNIDEIVSNMGENIMIISGVDDCSNLEVIEYIDKYPNVYGMIGIYPGNVDFITENSLSILETYIKHPKIVGIGEIGLDYHYPNTNKKKQQEIFKIQIELAKKYKKPIIIHSRDAYQDTYNILKEHFSHSLKIVFHCYSYSKECAKELKELGVKFGIGGVVTFKNSKKLKEVVEMLDMKDILLETDSPYLTPEPYRGRKNEPRNVKYVASKIAEIKGISLGKVFELTTLNAISQFDLPINL